jgi:hypothetical protein
MGRLEVFVDVKTCAVPEMSRACRSSARPTPERRSRGSTMSSSMKSRPKK